MIARDTEEAVTLRTPIQGEPLAEYDQQGQGDGKLAHGYGGTRKNDVPRHDVSPSTPRTEGAASSGFAMVVDGHFKTQFVDANLQGKLRRTCLPNTDVADPDFRCRDPAAHDDKTVRLIALASMIPHRGGGFAAGHNRFFGCPSGQEAVALSTAAATDTLKTSRNIRDVPSPTLPPETARSRRS